MQLLTVVLGALSIVTVTATQDQPASVNSLKLAPTMPALLSVWKFQYFHSCMIVLLRSIPFPPPEDPLRDGPDTASQSLTSNSLRYRTRRYVLKT